MEGRKVVNFCLVSDCDLAEKRYVNPKDVDTAKNYEKGDFIRAFCIKQSDWCDCETSADMCNYLQEFLDS